MALDRTEQGFRVRRVREALNVTREQFGRVLNCTGQTVFNIERGSSGLTVDTLSIIDSLGIRAWQYIVEGSADMFSLPYDEVMCRLDAKLRQTAAA